MDKEAIEELKKDIKDKEEEIKDLDNFELSDDEYDDVLDGISGDIEVFGTNYSASQVLKNVDEIRYNLGKSEEEARIGEEKQEELKDELEALKDDLEEAEQED